MNTQQTAFFFEIQQIPEDSKIFDELQNQQVCFSYFQVNQKYYLFVYQQKFIDIDRIEPFIHILDELDTKQRKIRSLRGFFLYILEIMDDGKDLQILRTNLQPSFWRKLRKILRQNKKVVLLEFLFGSHGSTSQIHLTKKLEEKIQIFENQIASLQEKVIHLENQNRVMEGTLNMLSAAPRSLKFDTSRPKEGPYYLQSK